MTDRDNLCKLITELAVVPGRVILSSGQEADYYIDLRRVTLHHAAAPLIGRVMLDLTADWDFAAVGGLTLGADPVAGAMLHCMSRPPRAVTWTPLWSGKQRRHTACNGGSRGRTWLVGG